MRHEFLQLHSDCRRWTRMRFFFFFFSALGGSQYEGLASSLEVNKDHVHALSSFNRFQVAQVSGLRPHALHKHCLAPGWLRPKKLARAGHPPRTFFFTRGGRVNVPGVLLLQPRKDDTIGIGGIFASSEANCHLSIASTYVSIVNSI